MGAKDAYNSLEDKWYTVIDSIDSKIPIKGTVEAVDSVVPSMLVFILVVILIIAFFAFFFLSSQQVYDAKFTLTTPDNKPVNDTLIKANLIENGSVIEELSGRTDSGGEITFSQIKSGQQIAFDINLSRGIFKKTYDITGTLDERIQLSAPALVLAPAVKQIFVKTPEGTLTRETIELTFSCKDSAKVPVPEKASFTAPTPIEITEPVNCALMATVNNSKYKQKTYEVNKLVYDLYLEGFEPTAAKLIVNIRSGGLPVSGTNFKVKISGDTSFETDSGSSSQATVDLAEGIYLIAVSDPKNNYGLVTQTVTVSGTSEVVMEVSKSVKSRTTLSVIDSSTNAPIENAIVNVRDSFGREIASSNTDSNGSVTFSFFDLGEYTFFAKKISDLNESYFTGSTTQTLSANTSLTIPLDKITNLNAGKTTVKVTDQDKLPVANARVVLKYMDNDGLVELLQEKNYAMTDINGEVTFIAGQITGKVYAYTAKGPFNGQSKEKLISLDQVNLFDVTLEVGTATIKINLTGSTGDKLNGTAELLLIEGQSADEHGLAGLIQVENGYAVRQVKAGQSVYVRIKADNYENSEYYYTTPQMLWSDKTYSFDIALPSQILEPQIKPQGVFNEEGAAVQTMAPGKKYYAKFNIESDSDYSNVLMHFRVGKETMMENDFMQIEDVETSGIIEQLRGVTFDSQKGYSYDSSNTTDGVAKWVNINWVDFGKGTREVKVWFRINRTAPPNQELQFFYKAKFDNTRKPPSTASQELYSETYPSIVYYAGTEAVCTGDFCANSEWLYSQKDQLYMDSPYSMKQVSDYSYHTTILNNSETTYGKSAKPIYLSMSILGDESDSRKIKIKEYEVKDAIGRLTGNTPIYSADNLEITSFEKNSVINTTLKLEGIESGAEVIHFELKSEGKIIYTKEVPISVVKEKDFKVVISPQFVPAMINTDIEATVNTEKDDPLPGATINLYIKEPGFDQYQLDSAQTDRMGRAIVKTGAHLQKAKVIIEIIKEGYSRQMFSTTVSEQLVTVSPEEIISELNTFTKREETKTLTFTNLAKVPLVIRKISFDSKFKDLINEDALQGYFNELSLEERTIKGEDYVDIPLMRIRLANAITEDNFIEPVDLKGTVKIIFEEPVSQLLYDVTLPLTVRVSSSANLESECLVIKPTSKTTMNTEKAQVQFDFEMINACSTDGVGIPLDALTVNSSSDVPGIAEISIRNTTGTSLGITAIDGAKRQLIDHIRAGEKMFGTITFAPGQEAIGKSVTLQVGYEAKFKGQTVKSSPSMIEYTVNVVNLKECMQITADSAPVPFNEKSTIRIDTTGCLGEMIDVILCKEDSGCSGGTDGKVTLSTKAFTIQNKAQEIQVYNPTYPGTYGVTIHARARGTAGFTYIGEIPTSFLERDSQYFNLNKFELNLVGNGSKDTALLTNKMVSERINVKANECIWGKKDSGFNWSQAMTFGMIGAMLGNMIGSIYNPNSGSSSSSNKSNNTKNPPTMSIAEKAKFDEQYGTTKIESNDFMSGNTATYYMGGTASQKISSGGMDTILTTQSRFDPAANQWLFQVDQTGGPTTVYPISAVGGTIDGTMLNTAINNASTDVANWQTTNGSSFRSNLAKVFGAGYSGGYNVLLNGVQGTSLSGANTSATIPAFKSTATYTPQNQNNINLNNASSPSISPFPSGNSTTNPKDWAPYVTHAPYDQIPLQAAHFAAVGAGGTNYFQLGLTVIGAVAGMLIGGYFNQYKCDEHYAVVPFDDFVILLQGTTINVISPSGASSGPNTNLKEISPDAGAVLFTLGGVSPAWDFTDAQFAADETVGVTFQNTGLNDTRPTYGILTLNAKLHEHGKVIHIPNSGTISSSEYDYDVFCQNGNFGKYWIGPDNNAGNCGGVVEKLYQQKYHLRIISAEPKDEESYIKKATTCYMGALTGATGPDALPKIKLNWSWSKINENDCDYLNPDHVYCDAAQFTIALTKKLATLDDFLAANGSNFNCPPDMIEQEVTDSIDAINSQPVYIVGGFIGVKDITISTNTTTDITKAIVKIENNSGAVQNSFMNIALKGYGDPVTQLKQWDVPTGTSTQEFELTTPEYDGIYYFTAVVNGTAGNSLPVSRAFVNRDHNASCWVPKTTQQIGGLPGIFYYVAGMDNPTFTQKIKNPQDLYNYINFGVYLTKDGFSEDFFKDFKEYYSKELLQIASPTERKIVDYLTSGKFRIIKKFSGDNTVEPGLYDVWVRLNAEDKFRIIDANNTTLDITLLLVKSPGVNSPFYSMPFDGLLGERGGRQGYGTAYKSGDVRSDAPITISNNDFKVYTFFDSASNPITSVTTKTTSTFEGVNSSVSTRGQLGTVSVLGGGQSILALTPNYATPIIMKYTLSGTSGNMAFGIENTSRAVATRGNVAYWTGAAKSKDFYGANAVESYYNTPDYRLSKMGEGIYGFEFNDASRKGNLYLKSILFTPIDGAAYLFATKEDNTQVWTPNTPFGTNAELDGIAGMEYNYKSSSIQSLQELFDAVSQGSVCLTNDGSTTSFWWNPAVLETESGQINSIAKQELALVGK